MERKYVTYKRGLLRMFLMAAVATIIFMCSNTTDAYATSWRPDDSIASSEEQTESKSDASDESEADTAENIQAPSSWRPNDDTIYQGEQDSPTGSLLASIGVFLGSLLGGVLEMLLSPLIQVLATALYSLLASGGCSIDSIIYGRVGGASSMNGNVAFFTFDLTAGNVYGTLSMFTYNMFVSIFTVILIVLIAYRLCCLIYMGGDGKSRNAFKQTILNSALLIAAMYVMPKAIDLLLYIRDVILYSIRTSGASYLASLTGKTTGIESLTQNAFGFGDSSLINMYMNAAKGDLFNSIIYLAVVVFTGYLAFNYISIALTFSILLVIFPLNCVMQLAFGGNRIRDWFMEILALAIVPVIDAILLMFPLVIMLMSSESDIPGPFTLLRFVMVVSIVPARNFVRSRLGLGTASAMEGAGFAGAVGAVMLGKSLASGIKGIGKATMAKKAEANTQQDRAMADKAAISHNDAQGKAKVESLQNSINKRLGKGSKAKVQGFDSNGKATSESMADIDGYKAKDYTKLNNEMEDKGVSTTQKNARLYQEGKADLANIENAVSRLNERKVSNNDAIKRLENENNSLNSQIGRNIQAKKTDGNAALQSKINANKQKIQALKSQNDSIGNRVNEFRATSKELQGTLSDFEKMGANVDVAKMQAFDNKANISNFEQPEILKNISPERRAELRLERADMLRSQARTRAVAGYTSLATGGLIGGASGMALGTSAMTMLGSAGMTLSSTITDNRLDRLEMTQERAGVYSSGIVGSLVDTAGVMVMPSPAIEYVTQRSGVIPFNTIADRGRQQVFVSNIDAEYGAASVQSFEPSYERASYGSGRDYNINTEYMAKANSSSQTVDFSANKYAKLYADYAATNSEQIISNADVIWTDAMGKIDYAESRSNKANISLLSSKAAEEYYDLLVSQGVYDNSDFGVEDREAFKNYVVGATTNIIEANLKAYYDNTARNVDNEVVLDADGKPKKIVEGFEKNAVPYDIYRSGGIK